MALEALDICLRVLKESTTNKFDNYNRQEQCIDHIPCYLLGLSRAHFFPTTFHEIAVYYMQWQIQGRSPGGPGSPLFSDQTEDRRAGGGEGRRGPEPQEAPLNLQNSKFSGNTPWCWALTIVVYFLQCN